MMMRLAKLLGLPSPAVLIGVLIAVAIPAVFAGVQSFRASILSGRVDTLHAQLTAEKRRAEAAEQTLTKWREKQAKADAAATQDAQRLHELEAHVAVQKGVIDDLQRKYGAQPVCSHSRAP